MENGVTGRRGRAIFSTPFLTCHFWGTGAWLEQTLWGGQIVSSGNYIKGCGAFSDRPKGRTPRYQIEKSNSYGRAWKAFFPMGNWCYTPMNIYATLMLQLFYRDKSPDIEWGAIYNNWLAQLKGQRRARIGSRCGVTRYKTTLPLQRRIILGTGNESEEL